MNAQDNLLKSDDGFYANNQPKADAIEEVTVSMAGVGAESAGEGAALTAAAPVRLAAATNFMAARSAEPQHGVQFELLLQHDQPPTARPHQPESGRRQHRWPVQKEQGVLLREL